MMILNFLYNLNFLRLSEVWIQNCIFSYSTKWNRNSEMNVSYKKKNFSGSIAMKLWVHALWAEVSLLHLSQISVMYNFQVKPHRPNSPNRPSWTRNCSRPLVQWPAASIFSVLVPDRYFRYHQPVRNSNFESDFWREIFWKSFLKFKTRFWRENHLGQTIRDDSWGKTEAASTPFHHFRESLVPQSLDITVYVLLVRDQVWFDISVP